MTLRTSIRSLVASEDLNFLLTNRIPRQLSTRFIGWFSRIETPWIRDLSIRLWQVFADLDLSDAKKSRFTSLHDCFTRELREGARPIDPDPSMMVSPCDAIVGASGHLNGVQVLQAKGFPYSLPDLIGTGELAEYYRNGTYVTLRLTSSMYHRFHSPLNWRIDQVTYIAGDTWNVNPIALKRVERLFCKNERAVISGLIEGNAQTGGAGAGAIGARLTLVPVAAILVASIRLHFVDVLLHLRYRGPNRIASNALHHRGQEVGWFQHGSTIIVFAPRGFRLCERLTNGSRIRMGEPLMTLPAQAEVGSPAVARSIGQPDVCQTVRPS